METITLPRTGEPPLRFCGEKISEAGGRWFAGREQNRWHELSVYETDQGRYVVAIGFRTCWQGESDLDRAVVCASPAEVAQALRDYDPMPERVGFPPGREYDERNRRLRAALRQQYDAAVSEVLSDERFAESPQDLEASVRIDRDRERYRSLLIEAKRSLPFSRGEACLILDALNGTWLLDDAWRWWPANVEDAIRLDGLDEKWHVEAKPLLTKIAQLTPVELCAVADAAELFWSDPNLEETEEALARAGLAREED